VLRDGRREAAPDDRAWTISRVQERVSSSALLGERRGGDNGPPGQVLGNRTRVAAREPLRA
jgi:hypothetical protein